MLVALAVAGCAGKPLNQIMLMPAPDVYEEGQIDPFVDNEAISSGVQPPILYATDRAPSEGDEKKKYRFYSDARGGALRLGHAESRVDVDETMTWAEARRISLLKSRGREYPITVSAITEYGVLAGTVPEFDPEYEADELPGQRFIAAIEERLATSRQKDVYLFVHGVKVGFENPLLVGTELWHFLGYNGAFIAYSWPSTPKSEAYFQDLDDATNSARYLRELILYVAEHSSAENIHVIGYSAGTRCVARMLTDLGMYGYLLEEDEIRERTKLGNVFLIGSDMDRQILSGYVLDGALRVPRSLTVYQSSGDIVLGLAKSLFARERSGQVAELGSGAREFMAENPRLRLIDVTNAEAGTTGHGHSYFRQSPWVSSDLLMTLLFDLQPQDRGLVRSDAGVWSFPDDYVTSLRKSLARVDPAVVSGPETE